MPSTRLLKTALLFAALLLAFVGHDTLAADAKPLKVYILVGQSNMEGHAHIKTLGYINEHAETKPLYDLLTDDEGNPATAKRVYVSNYNGFYDNNGVTTGKLTAGFGARRNPNELADKFGPEYAFGLTMEQNYDGPILIIKCAWGGKSLHTDFRPPSAGPYTLSDWQKENYPKQEGHGIPKDFEQWKKDKAQAIGTYYRMMTKHVNEVLADPGKVVPDYDKDAGYEIAGFVWFQGFNDMVDSHTYPHALGDQRFSKYSDVLELFIKDVRKEFKTPDMPFVIGVMGVGGTPDPESNNKSGLYFRQAMAAPAKTMKNVFAVETDPYWDAQLDAIDKKRNEVRQMANMVRNKHKNGPNADGSMTDAEQKAYMEKFEAELISDKERAIWERGASNAGYHYLGCGKTIAQIGDAFAKTLLKAK
jgi:alpha-galactosidase